MVLLSLKRDHEYNPRLNCTTFTLTKIKNVNFPTFGPPSFGMDYQFCNKREKDEWKYDAEARYPHNFHIGKI